MRCARDLLEIGRPNSRESGGDLEGESERRGFYIFISILQLRAQNEGSNYLRIVGRDSETSWNSSTGVSRLSIMQLIPIAMRERKFQRSWNSHFVESVSRNGIYLALPDLVSVIERLVVIGGRREKKKKENKKKKDNGGKKNERRGEMVKW